MPNVLKTTSMCANCQCWQTRLLSPTWQLRIFGCILLDYSSCAVVLLRDEDGRVSVYGKEGLVVEEANDVSVLHCKKHQLSMPRCRSDSMVGCRVRHASHACSAKCRRST